ncbi:hypothetical protein ZWY2020_028654 [Hordeum vulgare]|nr:hypothetical protein ZWY2020_028654 [Hordeum vulgare]
MPISTITLEISFCDSLLSICSIYDEIMPSHDRVPLAGKVAVITGGGSGIGKVTDAEFVRNGAKVVLTDIQDNLDRAVAAELGDPDTACYSRCDVTDEAQVAAAVDLAVVRHGRLHVMFNNAGITGGNYTGTAIESLDMAGFDRVMAVNLRGLAAGIKHTARAMVPRGVGCILCPSSTAGALGWSGPHAYSVSKTAVVGMVRSAAAELAARDMRVNAISPYPIATPMGARSRREMLGLPPGGAGDEELIRRLFDEDINKMGGGIVLRAEDVARAAVFLASDDATLEPLPTTLGAATFKMLTAVHVVWGPPCASSAAPGIARSRPHPPPHAAALARSIAHASPGRPASHRSARFAHLASLSSRRFGAGPTRCSTPSPSASPHPPCHSVPAPPPCRSVLPPPPRIRAQPASGELSVVNE